MENCKQNCLALAEGFRQRRRLILALGDETRQQVFLTLLEQEEQAGGLRVCEIARLTHLSRPAASHHLKILRETGVISMRREGTKNFYYMNAGTDAWDKLCALLEQVCEVVHLARQNGYPAEEGQE